MENTAQQDGNEWSRKEKGIKPVENVALLLGKDLDGKVAVMDFEHRRGPSNRRQNAHRGIALEVEAVTEARIRHCTCKVPPPPPTQEPICPRSFDPTLMAAQSQGKTHHFHHLFLATVQLGGREGEREGGSEAGWGGGGGRIGWDWRVCVC